MTITAGVEPPTAPDASAGSPAWSTKAEGPHAAEVTVSVLVPTLNEEVHIRETFREMRGQRGAGVVELLFIDGRSSDGTRALLEELAAGDELVRILDNPARRTTDALNIGLKAARGEYIARMDAHSRHPRDYLALGIERLRRGDVDQVAGPAIPEGTGKWSRRVALALGCTLGTLGSRKWEAAASDHPTADERERELDTGVYAGVWRRSTLERLGGWDVRWPVNQDSELAARILESGGRIVLLPRMGARYIPRNSIAGLARQYVRFGTYRAKTARHHPISLRRSHLLAPGVVFCAVVSLTPHRLAWVPRAGLAGYVTVLISAGVATARSAPWRDAASVPLLLAVMHTSWGVGFLGDALRHGPPVRAVLRSLAPAR